MIHERVWTTGEPGSSWKLIVWARPSGLVKTVKLSGLVSICDWIIDWLTLMVQLFVSPPSSSPCNGNGSERFLSGIRNRKPDAKHMTGNLINGRVWKVVNTLWLRVNYSGIKYLTKKFVSRSCINNTKLFGREISYYYSPFILISQTLEHLCLRITQLIY